METQIRSKEIKPTSKQTFKIQKHTINLIDNITKYSKTKNFKCIYDAINLIIEVYGKELLEPELRPEFLKELLAAQKAKTVRIKDFSKHYG